MRKQLFDKAHNKPKKLAWERSLVEKIKKRDPSWGIGGTSTHDKLERQFVRMTIINVPDKKVLRNNPAARAQANGDFHYSWGHDVDEFKKMAKAGNKRYNKPLNVIRRFFGLS